MLFRMGDLVKKYVGALGSERAEELAQEVVDWSKRSRDRVAEAVRREVRRQLKAIGVATQGELSELKKRVRTLERQIETTSGKTTSSRSSTRKRSSSKSSGTKRSQAKRSSSRGTGSSSE